MCYALQLNMQQSNALSGGGGLDDVYAENVELHNELNRTAVNTAKLDRQINIKQSELDVLTNQYKLIVKNYPVINVLSIFAGVPDTINIVNRVNNLFKQIQYLRHEIRQLQDTKKQYAEKSEPINKGINNIHKFLHDDLARIDVVLRPNLSGGDSESYRRKYLKYKSKYHELKKSLK